MQKSLTILGELIKGDFKLRYQSSYLGYLWTLVKPLALFAVIYTVFSTILAVPTENYAIYLLIGIIIWTFFNEATAVGLMSLQSKRDLITKLNFPRHLIVVAATLTSTITLAFNLAVLLVFLMFSGLMLSWTALAFLPLIVLLYLITAGLAFVLAALYARFHDLQHIWEVLLQIIFWMTPIIYPLSIVPEQFHYYIMASPLAQVIDLSRTIFIAQEWPNAATFVALSIVSIAVFLVGLMLFRSQAAKLAERI